ncbi:hypothetical protein PR202_gb19315 [Eleusine coracana subsp. coracana]|uniref:VPS9 domain-containing protein n=1 Tax=Eleusine coracana subsp. coracana TaxID=191504 RepID=A0AAV5F7T1_ELECO|nr:hypothetical protein PR202_gb19315 [Eleusine coracana subsp. coracana]
MEGGGDSSTAPLAWHDFLERMRQPSAAEFVKSIKGSVSSSRFASPNPLRFNCSYVRFSPVAFLVNIQHYNLVIFHVYRFIVTFSNRAPDPEKDSVAVQEFLENMEGAFRAHTPWAGSSEEELESAGEGLEKYVMTKLFNRVFASVPEDVKSDEELFEKMSLLQQFIRPENLDIKPEYQNETSWLLAQKELQKINLYKAPRDKLACILNCCKVINNLLLNASVISNDNPPGADEFLPVLIYVTIKVWLISYTCNRNSDVSLYSKDHVQGSGQDMRRDSDVTVSGKQVERAQSIPDLENKGATELLNNDDLNKKFQEYPFLFARAGDLTVADVENLLNSYKQIVLRYVALAQEAVSTAGAEQISQKTAVDPSEDLKTQKDESSDQSEGA